MTSGPEGYRPPNYYQPPQQPGSPHYAGPRYPAPAPKKPFWKRGWVLVLSSIIGTVLAIGALGKLAGDTGDSTSGPATVTETVSPTAEAPAPATTKPNVSRQAMAEWKQRTEPHFRKMIDAFTATQDCDSSACLKPGCSTAHDAITVGLNGELPSPDPRMTDALNAMIGEFDKGMHLCMDLPASPTKAQMARMKSHVARADEHLNEALAILDEYSAAAA